MDRLMFWYAAALLCVFVALAAFGLYVRLRKRSFAAWRSAAFDGRQSQRREAARLASLQMRRAPLSRRERRATARFIASTVKSDKRRTKGAHGYEQ